MIFLDLKFLGKKVKVALDFFFLNHIRQPTPVSLPGKVHGQRSLAACSPWGYMTEHVCMRVEGDGLVAMKW